MVGSMKRWLLLPVLAVLLVSCAGNAAVAVTAVSPTNTPSLPISQSPNTPLSPSPMPTDPPQVNLPDLGAAPEIENTVWINADEPVTITSQRGKVILLEFWTFG